MQRDVGGMRADREVMMEKEVGGEGRSDEEVSREGLKSKTVLEDSNSKIVPISKSQQL